MKKVKLISEGKNHTAVALGSFDDITEYSILHPKRKVEIKGKVFLKEATEATGTEISIDSLAPKSEVGYFHKHIKNEETYIIIKGEGYYQVDDVSFPIKEGSVIRVATEGVRSLCNTSDENMLYLCIQSKENSLEEYSADDGELVAHKPKWNND